MHRSVFAVVALAVSLVLAGCSPEGSSSDDGSPRAGSPSISVPLPPSSVGAELDALYAEAEQVFLRSLELRDQFELRGDFSEFPPELNDLLADRYLASVHELYDFYKDKGWHSPEGTVPITTVKPYPGASKAGSEVALQACMDTRPTPSLDHAGQIVSEGKLYRLELFFGHFDGKLKLFDGSSSEVLECALG
ncbi:MAG: hypothetical protein VB040_01975 [Propionibacterium sp.]|nr:hypothetical protein [Propionibacterium sp.]